MQNTQTVPSVYPNGGALPTAVQSTAPNVSPMRIAAADKKVPLAQTSYASPPSFVMDALETKDTNSGVPSQPTASLVSPPTSLVDETDHEHGNVHVHASIGGEHPTALQMPNSSSRHSSRQPRQVERYVPQVLIPAHKPKPARRPSGTSARASPSGMRKPSSRPTSSHAKNSASPATGKRLGMHSDSSLSPQSKKRDRAQITEDDVDPESMRLIQQLQSEDFSLRNRPAKT